MLFNYKALDSAGNEKSGSVDAVSQDIAITSLQRRGLTISAITAADEGDSFFALNISFFDRVTNKDVVILSRQISVLFEAQVSALRIFRLLAAESEKLSMAKVLTAVADDLQGGSAISKALARHPKIFSPFYVNMVHAGEEAGKLDQTLAYLADYLDRSYEVTSKARNALIYPAFVVATFIVVMILMLTLIIPKISAILLESGQAVPIYTKVVIGASNFFIDYGLFFAVGLVIGGVGLWRYALTPTGKTALSDMKLSVPYVGTLYKKLYLSRISDNLSTMLSSGIAMVQALEITANVVGNDVYERLLRESAETVKGGKSVSDALGNYPEVPGIMVQMIKIGEETGELGNILKTLAKFYQREVTNAVDTLVDLIEPVMIVLLGLGVGLLLMAVLVPIYNLASSF
ncbi:MAG TPA: type II secretion system F family protein [Candidatus Paceibacterota bacterium]